MVLTSDALKTQMHTLGIGKRSQFSYPVRSLRISHNRVLSA